MFKMALLKICEFDDNDDTPRQYSTAHNLAAVILGRFWLLPWLRLSMWFNCLLIYNYFKK